MEVSGLKMRICQKEGVILIIVLELIVIFLITGLALFTSSFFVVKSKIATTNLYLAEAAEENVRGNMQNYASGTATAPPANSCGLITPTVSQLFMDGSPVSWPMPSSLFTTLGESSWKSNICGFKIVNPENGNQTLGYGAYFLIGGAQGAIQIYAMGAKGTSANNILSTETIHVKIKPYTYSQYTLFMGDPNQTLDLNENYTDPFFTSSQLFQPCNSPCAPNYTAGNQIQGGASMSNFNKLFIAGNLNVTTNSNQTFNGFNLATFDVLGNPNLGPNPVSVSNASSGVNIPNSPPPMLFTGSEILQSQGVTSNSGEGLPNPGTCAAPCSGSATTPSQVQTIMDQLYNMALGQTGTGGVILNNTPTSGNPFQIANNSFYSNYTGGSYVPTSPAGDNFVPSTQDPYTLSGSTNPNYIPNNNTPTTSSSGEITYNWDPTTVIHANGPDAGQEDTTDTAGNVPYNITLYPNGTVYITNFYNSQPTYINGNTVTEGPSSALTLNLTNPLASNYINHPIIYVKGNVNVSGTLNGSLTIAAEGKITITGNITYADETYTPVYSSGTQTGYKITPNSQYNPDNPDLLGLITPRKIEVGSSSAPLPNPQNMIISASMQEIGSDPYPVGFGAADPSIQWTEDLNEYSPSYSAGQTYDSITFYGSQVGYDRNKNWVNYYLNGRISTSDTSIPTSPFQIFDTNLLHNNPPYAITTSAGYGITYWAIINPESGADETAPLP